MSDSLAGITKPRQLLHHSLSYASPGSSSMHYSDGSPPAAPSTTSSLPSSFAHSSGAMSSSAAYSSTTLPSSYSPTPYGGSHHTRQSSAYSTTSPVRLPLPAPSRYAVEQQDMGGLDVHDDGSDGMWVRKSISLAMFYGPGTGKVCKCSLTGRLSIRRAISPDSLHRRTRQSQACRPVAAGP